MSSRLLFIDDDPSLLLILKHTFEKLGYITDSVQNPELALEKVSQFYPHLICMDISMPGINGLELLKEVKNEYPQIPVIMVTAINNLDTAIDSLRSGAFHYIRKPINREEIIATVEHALEYRKLSNEIVQKRKVVKTDFSVDDLVGESKIFKDLRQQIIKLSELPEVPILITGETGTGKSFLAKILHYSTPSTQSNSFVEINAGAIPSTIFESELFGYMKGAFTDAKKDKIGLVEEAQDGTLFLDEIDSVPILTQSKLLTVLESKKIRRIGGTKDITVSTRIMVATNSDLEQKVRVGEFREDLFYRINVIKLRMPSLKEVKEDIPVIAQNLLKAISAKYNKPDSQLSQAATDKLKKYHYPGNVRELRNILERSLIFCQGDTIESKDIQFPTDTSTIFPTLIFGIESLTDLETLEKNYIHFILEKQSSSYQEAARILNISAKNLWEKRKKYGFEVLTSNETETEKEM